MNQSTSSASGRAVRAPAGGQSDDAPWSVEHELLAIDAVTVAGAGRSGTPPVGARATRRTSGSSRGGQLELSWSLRLRAVGAGAADRATTSRPPRRLRAAGVRLQPSPVTDGRGHVPLRLGSPRYVAMQRHFDTIGSAGRTMMRRTASTQVCLDWWPGRAGLEQWRVLHLSAPFLAAAFARRTGAGSRLATWLAVDPSRTAFDDRLVHGADPVAAYADFARGATVFASPDDATSI